MSTVSIATLTPAARKAANIAAYERRCAELARQQDTANKARRLGFVGSDTHVIALAEADMRQRMARMRVERDTNLVREALADRSRGGHILRKWLAGRQSRPIAELAGLIRRFYRERPDLPVAANVAKWFDRKAA